MPASFSLEGKAALVTGATRGIGRAIAEALGAAGAAVAVCARSAEDCASAAADLSLRGIRAVAIPANVSHQGVPESLTAQVLDAFGSLDILVNNAATNPQFGPLIDADSGAVAKVFDVNLHAPLRLIGASCRAWMDEHGGSIINISSINAIRTELFLGAYGASKAALIHETRTLARELGGKQIRVNAIAPGLIRTRFASALIENDTIRDEYIRNTPLGRVGEPEDIGGAAVFLASDAAAYVTGAVIVVDGGRTI